MRREGNPKPKKELINKLETIQALAADCLTLLVQSRQLQKSRPTRANRSLASTASLSIESNARAFVRRHCKDMSGPKKFVLILGYLTKGDISREAPLGDIKKLWNTMKSRSVLGMKFNLFFSNKAKESGWVNSKKRGFYNLDRSWKDIFLND